MWFHATNNCIIFNGVNGFVFLFKRGGNIFLIDKITKKIKKRSWWEKTEFVSNMKFNFWLIMSLLSSLVYLHIFLTIYSKFLFFSFSYYLSHIKCKYSYSLIIGFRWCYFANKKLHLVLIFFFFSSLLHVFVSYIILWCLCSHKI